MNAPAVRRSRHDAARRDGHGVRRVRPGRAPRRVAGASRPRTAATLPITFPAPADGSILHEVIEPRAVDRRLGRGPITRWGVFSGLATGFLSLAAGFLARTADA